MFRKISISLLAATSLMFTTVPTVFADQADYDQIVEDANEVARSSANSASSSNNSAYNAAKSQKKQAIAGAVVNIGMAALMTTMCVSSYGTDAWACYAAGALAVAGSLLSSSGSQAGSTAASIGDGSIPTFDTNFQGYTPDQLADLGLSGSTTNDNGTGVVLDESGLDTNLDSVISTLAGAGFSIDPESGTVTGPDGTTVSTKDINLEDATQLASTMSEAGVSTGSSGSMSSALKKLNASAAELQKAQKQVESEASVSKRQLASAGAGGYSQGGSNGSGLKDGEGDANDLLASLMKKRNGKKGAVEVAGKSVVVGNGERIGVKMDNIFDMLHRRYQKKVQQGIFIEQKSTKK